MRSYVSVAQTTEAELANAILIYNVVGKGEACATVHDVLPATVGAPALGPGRPITKEFLSRLLLGLEGKRTRQAADLIPENLLARTDDAAVWWTPATVRKMFFKGMARKDTAVKGLNGKAKAHPPLIWAVSKTSHLQVFALPANARPDAATPLSMAPYWNVDKGGNVCQGSMRSPVSPTDLLGWEKAFFASAFTHPNSDKLTKHKGGFAGLWTSTGEQDFDMGTLLPIKNAMVASILGGL